MLINLKLCYSFLYKIKEMVRIKKSKNKHNFKPKKK